jgi:FkbM family methyltransferase
MDGIRFVARQVGGLRYMLAVPEKGDDPYHTVVAEHGMWTAVPDCLLSLVSPGDTILDIGANIGTVAIPAAAKGLRVIAYEPLAENARLLEAAVRANRLEGRVTIRNVAAWESAGQLSFTGVSAWGRVVAEGEATHAAVAIDTDLASEVRIKAIKIDVEGSELHVLRGMRRLLASQQPHIIFESNSLELGRLGSSATMIFNFLGKFGYRIYRIYGWRRLMRAGRTPQEIGVVDYLATRLGSFGLRRLSGMRVGPLRSRHIVRHILLRGDDACQDHMHVLAVAGALPGRVVRNRAVAARIAGWRERYRDDPLIDVMRRGQFHDPATSKPATVAE